MHTHTQKESLYLRILKQSPQVASHLVSPVQVRQILLNPTPPPTTINSGRSRMRVPSRNNKGFTLIELLAVVICITIFSAVLLTSNQNSAQQANDVTCLQQKAQLKEALEGWAVAQPSTASVRAAIKADSSQAALLARAQSMMSPATRGNYRILNGQIATDASINNKQSLRLAINTSNPNPGKWWVSVGDPDPTPDPTPAPEDNLPTPTPEPSPDHMSSPTPTPTPTATPGPSAVPTATPAPTLVPTPTPAPTATATPEASASPSPSASPTGSPSPTPVVQSPGDSNFSFGNSVIAPTSTEVGQEILLTVVPAATGTITDTVWLYLTVPTTMNVELVTSSGWNREPDIAGASDKLVVLRLDVPTPMANPVISLVSTVPGTIPIIGQIGYFRHVAGETTFPAADSSQTLARPWWKSPATPTPTPTPSPFVEVIAEPGTPSVITDFWTSGTMTVKFKNTNPYAVAYSVSVEPTNAFMDGGNNIYGTALGNSVVDISSHLNFKSLGANPSFTIKIYRNGVLDVTSTVVWPSATPTPTP